MLLFDRQILYLVFLFGSSVHAAPAPTPVPSLSTSTASRDDSPTLSLNISPQIISSAGAFAARVVSAILPSGSSSSSSSGLRSSVTYSSNDERSTSESYPPTAVQTATGIVTPSPPKNPAAVSSSSTRRRSRISHSTSLPLASDSASSTSTTLGPNQERPLPTSSTTEARIRSQHHTTQAGPTHTYAAAAQLSTNLTAINRPINQESQSANMTGATVTHDDFGHLLTAIGQVGALSGSDPASATGLGATTDGDKQPSPTNALDVLISALPSSLAAPIQSEYSDIIDPLGSGINSLTHNIFGAGGTSSRTHTRPTSSPSIPTSSSTTPSSTTATTTSTPTPTPSTTVNEDPTSTMQTRPSNTDTAQAAATTTPAGTSAARPSENAATIGIATGVASGVVLIGIAGLYLWRRRKQGKAPFARTASKRGVYPEVAWLYDPNITPPRSRTGSGSGTHLIPDPRPGSVEIGGTPIRGGGGNSPEMRPAQPSSPLLAPVLRGSRDMVGSRSRSGSEVDFERLRPLDTLREEPGRHSMS